MASTPEFVYYFGDAKTGNPDGAYLDAVRKRFALWILDTAEAKYDQAVEPALHPRRRVLSPPSDLVSLPNPNCNPSREPPCPVFQL